ncbi:MAG: Gfo/Idh/MocA family oxidoreductase [Bacteroidales bacterium]|jgi:predicted dehydrogenase|nr:Gfo/Idh/MocA family oxidoreductase [Bacteroidales bacterium]
MLRFAIIGYGHIGTRHAEIITQNPHCELVAVCDVLPKEELGLGSSNFPFFSSCAELLHANIAIDVVCVCTPNALHCEQAIMALQTGKHVVVEKPLALTTHDAECIIAAAERAERKVFCVMQNRYSPPAQWLKSVIDRNLLGDIFMAQIQCFWNRDERYYSKGAWHGRADLDGGTLFTQFSHFVDMLYWLFGDITNISARFADFNHAKLTDFEDSGVVTFDFVRGGMGSLSYSTAVWNKNFEISLTVIGARGTVKINGEYMNEVAYCHIENYEMPQLPIANPPNNYGIYKGSAQNHGYVIENVVQTLLHAAPIATPACEGRMVVNIIERMYAQKSSLNSEL